MVSRRKVLQLLSGASAVSLAGCFGGGSSPDSGGTTEDPGLEVTTRAFGNIGTSTAAREYSNYAWNRLEGADPVDTSTVTLTSDAEFLPMIARVPPGTTVTWEIESNQPESVTIPKIGVDMSTIGGGDQLQQTFEEPGLYNYLCKHHEPDHIGRIVVDEAVTANDDQSTDTSTE